MTQEKKRWAVFLSLGINYNDLQITNFLKTFRAFVFRENLELEKRKKHAKLSRRSTDVFVSRVPDIINNDPSKLLRVIIERSPLSWVSCMRKSWGERSSCHTLFALLDLNANVSIEILVMVVKFWIGAAGIRYHLGLCTLLRIPGDRRTFGRYFFCHLLPWFELPGLFRLSCRLVGDQLAVS